MKQPSKNAEEEHLQKAAEKRPKTVQHGANMASPSGGNREKRPSSRSMFFECFLEALKTFLGASRGCQHGAKNRGPGGVRVQLGGPWGHFGAQGGAGALREAFWEACWSHFGAMLLQFWLMFWRLSCCIKFVFASSAVL